MTQQTQAAGRPPQVTMAGWVAMVGSVFLILGLYDAIAGLHSLDNREVVTDLLKSAPYSGLGVSVEEWLSISQVVFTIAGGCAAVAAICGFYVLQRNKGARIGLSVAAIPLLFSGFIPGGPFTAALVAVSAVLLWTGPSRDWFAGRAVRQTVTRRPERPEPPAPPAASPPLPPSMPAPMPPPVWPPAGGSPDAPEASAPTGAAAYSGFGAPRPPHVEAPLTSRPAPLIAACVITWVCSLAVIGLFSLAALAIVGDPAAFDAEIAKQPRVAEMGLTHDDIRNAAFIGLAFFILWALVAAVLALLVMLRMRWARPLLIISAVLAGLFSFAAISIFVPVVTGVAGMVTAYLLLRPEVSRWLDRR